MKKKLKELLILQGNFAFCRFLCSFCTFGNLRQNLEPQISGAHGLTSEHPGLTEHEQNRWALSTHVSSWPVSRRCSRTGRGQSRWWDPECDTWKFERDWRHVQDQLICLLMFLSASLGPRSFPRVQGAAAGPVHLRGLRRAGRSGRCPHRPSLVSNASGTWGQDHRCSGRPLVGDPGD